MRRQYEAVVIGAGQAGPGVAAALAARGERVALVELADVGGTCVNHGCRPTKALRASAATAYAARRAEDFGVRTGEVTVDFPVVMRRARDVIETTRASLRDWLASVEHLDLLPGQASLASDPAGREHRVRVGDDELVTGRVYLDVGARAAAPPLDGLAAPHADAETSSGRVPYLTEVELLALTERPAHLVVVGGGVLGCEFGQMFRRLGSEVTMLVGSGLAAGEDDDVREILTDTFRGEGITVVEQRAAAVSAGPDGGVRVTLPDGGEVTGSHLLVAAGRRSNLDLLGPEHGLATDDQGHAVVDGRYRSSVPGVWVLGDANGRGAWTHTAYQDSQILLDPDRGVDGRVTTYAVFTDPPLGRVGMGLAEARASGRRVLKAEVPMSRVSRAVLEQETVGVMRILVDADTEELLGATILGRNADDLVQVVGTALQAGVRYPAVRDALPIHPTMAEFIPSILGSLSPL